jgi:hypothetical protein
LWRQGEDAGGAGETLPLCSDKCPFRGTPSVAPRCQQ